MFLSHYGFRESPFGVTSDPRYLYASETHREALAALLYGINSGLGFMALTAIPGMGKTTLLFEVLGTIRHQAVTVFLFQSVSTPVELLCALLTDLGISSPQGGLIELQVQLNELLIKNAKEGKRFVVAIDEAQNLNDSVLEQVRMLSNFETSREKLMQIILAGQPQLAKKLASPELLQLRQRISIVAHLEPLSPLETAAYIRHRLTIAGYSKDAPLFSSSAIEIIARESEGIPRNINNLCFNALSIGYALKQTTIGPEVIREVIADLDLKRLTVGKKNDDTHEPPVAEKRTNYDTREPLVARKEKNDTREPSLQYLFESEVDKPEWREFLILKVFPLLCVLALVLGFVYVRSHWADRGSILSGILTKIPPQPTVSATAADPATEAGVTPETPAKIAPQPAAGTNTAEPPSAASTDAVESTKTADPATQETREAPAAPVKVHPLRSVRVRRGQTLYKICAENFKDCGPNVYQAVLDANPGIQHPNHIVSGQKVYLPPYPSSSSNEAKY